MSNMTDGMGAVPQNRSVIIERSVCNFKTSLPRPQRSTLDIALVAPPTGLIDKQSAAVSQLLTEQHCSNEWRSLDTSDSV